MHQNLGTMQNIVELQMRRRCCSMLELLSMCVIEFDMLFRLFRFMQDLL